MSGEEELRPLPKPGEVPRPKPSKEDTVAFPKCTNEGIGYVLECWPCRLEGKEARYIGESSRSAFQRGKEHMADIKAGKKAHPINIHFSEVHEGKEQEVIMRTLTTPQTALARQVAEAVRIRRRGREGAILNSRGEFNRCYIPRLKVEEEEPDNTVETKNREHNMKPFREQDRSREGSRSWGLEQ